MFSDRPVLFILLLAATLALRVVAQEPDRESVNFSGASEFAALRNCATCCFGGGLGCYFNQEITAVVGCSLNSCLCSRTDIQTIITSHLRTCVSRSCSSVSGDVSIALSVFGAYCDNYLGVEAPANATPVDGDGGGSPVTVTETRTIPLSTFTTALETATIRVAATTITVFPDDSLPNEKATGTSTVTVTAKSSSGLSEDAKIGLGVGLGIGIPLVAAALFIAYRFTRALTAPPEMPQPIQGSYVG